MTPVCAVLVHVADCPEGLAWHRRAFPAARTVQPAGGDWTCLEVGGVLIEIVSADEKVASGTAGTVVYRHADDFDDCVEHLRSIGAVLYRGPMEIEGGTAMCQLRDPFGNLIGVRGPRRWAGEA